MFLEYWMIGAFVIVVGVWSEYRHSRGVRSGIDATISVLHEKKMIKIDSDGHMVKHPHA
jgi:hypothetical protein